MGGPGLIMTYREFLQGLQLTHFRAEEVTSQGDRTRDGEDNSLPPSSMWPAMVRPLWVADMARSRTGIPLTITSAYRNESYNEAVGGAPHSAHKRNEALDLIPAGGRIDELWRALVALRQGGAFKGGLGYYARRFIHIDTRGTNATWGIG